MPKLLFLGLLPLLMSGVGCRSIRSVSSPVSMSAPTDAFCNPAVEKSLTCQVRDIVARAGSKSSEAKKSELFKTQKLNLTIYSSVSNKNPLIEFVTSDGPEGTTRFENTTDLYQRNGCLAELTGGIFSEGFTPRVSLKILLSAKNADYAVFAEVSDYRYHNPVHMTLDLQCDRKISK